jgi:hypothetical protein
MKKVYKAIFLFIAVGAMFISCDKTKLEGGFEAMTKSFDTNMESNLVFLNGSMLYEVENNVMTDDTIAIKLQIWGPLKSVDETVTISVDAAASTAVDGVDYTLNTTSVVIPANTGGAHFNLIMHCANFAKGDTVLLVMNLSNADFQTSLPAATANLRLSKKPECPFSIKTFTGAYVADEAGYGKYNVSFKADATNPTRIWQSNFWDWTNDLLAFDLDPLTGTVTVPSQMITMGDGNPYEVVGSGTFDPCTGIMVVDFQGDVDGTHEVYSPGSVKKSLLMKKK